MYGSSRATATKYYHTDINHLSVSVAVVFLYIAIANAATVMQPDRGVLAQLCFHQDDFSLLPMYSYYQDFDHAQSQDFDTQPPVTLVRPKDFWYPHFRW